MKGRKDKSVKDLIQIKKKSDEKASHKREINRVTSHSLEWYLLPLLFNSTRKKKKSRTITKGSTLVSWLIDAGRATDESDAIEILQELLSESMLRVATFQKNKSMISQKSKFFSYFQPSQKEEETPKSDVFDSQSSYMFDFKYANTGFTIIHFIHNSILGTNCLCLDESIGDYCIIKFVKKKNLSEVDSLFHLAVLLNSIEHHPNLLIPSKILQTEKQYLLYTKISNLSWKFLEYFLSFQPFSESTVLEAILDISNGLNHLHEKGLVFNNLNFNTVYVVRKTESKCFLYSSEQITTFSILASEIQLNSGKDLQVNTYFSSPETIQNSIVDTKSDVWSLGVCIYSILRGLHLPYFSFDTKFLVNNFQTKIAFPERKQLSASFKIVLLQFLSSDMNKRPSCQEILALASALDVNKEKEMTLPLENVPWYHHFHNATFRSASLERVAPSTKSLKPKKIVRPELTAVIFTDKIQLYKSFLNHIKPRVQFSDIRKLQYDNFDLWVDILGYNSLKYYHSFYNHVNSFLCFVDLKFVDFKKTVDELYGLKNDLDNFLALYNNEEIFTSSVAACNPTITLVFINFNHFVKQWKQAVANPDFYWPDCKRGTEADAAKEGLEKHFLITCDNSSISISTAYLQSTDDNFQFLHSVVCGAFNSEPISEKPQNAKLEKINLKNLHYRKPKYPLVTKDFITSLYENLCASDCAITYINLRNNIKEGFEGLSTTLQYNSTLKVLNLSCNRMGDVFFKELFINLETSVLEQLIISDCGITHSVCTDIKAYLSNNPNLKILDLSQNSISDVGVIHISDGLVRNRVLTHLDLFKCGISSPGVSAILNIIRIHPTIEYLNIDCNNIDLFSYELIIKTIKDNFSSRLNLLVAPFSIANTDFDSTVSKRYKIMEECKEIYLQTKPVWRDTIIELSKKIISGLDFSHLSIKEFKKCKKDNSFDKFSFANFSGNIFHKMPSAILHFSNLRMVNFSNNKLKTIGVQLKHLQQLEELYLHSNFLSNPLDIDTSLAGVLNLRILDLRFNQLSRCPRLHDLVALKELLLDYNPIMTAPNFSYLELENLSLFGTQLNPTFIQILYCSTRELQYIDLSYSKISYLPKEIGLLQCLVNLNMQGNSISYLPPQMETLSSLRILVISDNQFNSIQSIISVAKLDLVEINISNNPLPPQLLAQTSVAGIQEILVANIQKTIKLPKVKLGIVGLQNTGKSAIAKLLTASNDYKSLKKLTSSPLNLTPTDGIEISNWEVDSKGEQPIQFNIWDFSGNEIYHTSHLFFLTNRTIYLLTFNMALPESKQRQHLKYWLDMLTSCTNNCPIILVGTHMDEFQGDFEEFARIYSEYGKKYNNVSTIVTFSAQISSTVDLLRETIVDICKKQSFFTKNVSGGYIPLESLIKSESKIIYPPLISMTEFEKMIISCGIDGSTQTIAEFLTLLGISYFAKGLSNGIVNLDPKWFVSLLSTIITYKHNLDHGYLYHKEFSKIWSNYPESIHDYILELFNKLELVYTFHNPHPEKGEYSVVPSLLDTQRPFAAVELHWIAVDDYLALSLGTQLERIYKFDSIKVPFGFFSRLTVRLLHFTSPLVIWRNGIICEKGEEKIFVECEVNNEISVKIRGKDPAKVLRLIVENIDLLLAGWYNTPRTIIVPFILKGYQQALSDKYIFTLEELEQAAAQGKKDVLFREGNEEHNIAINSIAPDLVLSDLSGIIVNYSEFEMLEEIGRGGFGVVYKAKYNGEIVAIKQVLIDDNMKTEAFREFRREVALSSELQQPNIVMLKCVCLDPWCLVMDFLPHGDLYSFLHNRKNDMPWRMILTIAKNIAEAIRFLHSFQPKIIHRDLKSPNCLVCNVDPDAEHIVKVTDFGESRAVATSYTGRDRLQNPVWLAPEIMKKEQYTEKADVFSFGIILWELIVREKPFNEFEVSKSDFTFQLEDAIISGLRPTIPPTCGRKYRELIEECWDGDPKRRPQFEEICRRLYQIQKNREIINSLS